MIDFSEEFYNEPTMVMREMCSRNHRIDYDVEEDTLEVVLVGEPYKEDELIEQSLHGAVVSVYNNTPVMLKIYHFSERVDG